MSDLRKRRSTAFQRRLSIGGALTLAAARIHLVVPRRDRKSTRLNSSHTVIYTLSLHDALPIYVRLAETSINSIPEAFVHRRSPNAGCGQNPSCRPAPRSEEHTSELQSHSDLHSFPTRRSSDLCPTCGNVDQQHSRGVCP